MFQHPTGRLLYSRCHLYLFSFSESQARLYQLTCDATAHLLRFLFSDCSSKSVIRAGSPYGFHRPVLAMGEWSALLLFSLTLLRYSVFALVPGCRILSIFRFALVLAGKESLFVKRIRLFSFKQNIRSLLPQINLWREIIFFYYFHNSQFLLYLEYILLWTFVSNGKYLSHIIDFVIYSIAIRDHLTIYFTPNSKSA